MKSRFGYLVLAGALIAGCNKQAGESPQSTNEMMKEAGEMAAAMQSGEPLVCTVTDPDGVAVEYQVMGQRMRVKGVEMNETTGNMINDGKNVYIWEEGASEGMMMPVNQEVAGDELEKAGEQYAKEVPDFTNEEEVDDYESRGYAIDCNPGEFGEEVFSPPAEVNFVDFAAKMQENIDAMKESMEDMGMGVEQMQEMMGGMNQ